MGGAHKHVKMTSTGAIFLKEDSDYKDMIATVNESVGRPTTQYDVGTIIYYKGQNFGYEDFKLVSLVKRNKPIHVFIQESGCKKWKYLGYSLSSQIRSERAVEVGQPAEHHERLTIELLLPKMERGVVPHDAEFAEKNPRGAKYKHDCLYYLGVREPGSGVSTEYGKFASRNLNQGIFGW